MTPLTYFIHRQELCLFTYIYLHYICIYVHHYLLLTRLRWTLKTWRQSLPTSRWRTWPLTWRKKSWRRERLTSRGAITSGGLCSRRRLRSRARGTVGSRNNANAGRCSLVSGFAPKKSHCQFCYTTYQIHEL